MFAQIKPGHVLRFGTDPSTIISPNAANAPGPQDNQLESHWPTTSQLGQVRCVSHPAGALGEIAAAVATGGGRGPSSFSRTVSYSGVGRALTASDRLVAQETCDFVGYTDGRSYYIDSNRTVFSKDFSGCLMVCYSVAGQRRVAHSAASAVARMDCKQAFLNTLQQQNAVLHGWFRPYSEATDVNRKLATFQNVSGFIGGDVNRLVTFGVVTATNEAWAIDAFRPTGTAGGTAWVVTYIVRKTMSQAWNVT